jgi:hypothetical protein
VDEKNKKPLNNEKCMEIDFLPQKPRICQFFGVEKKNGKNSGFCVMK